METFNYDIFLSYRRDGGFETAKHLYDLLTRDGYSVSFDIDTLRAGDFDAELLQRIDRCTDFILILDKNAFLRSIDPTFDRNKDWLRIELARALEKKKNIIPVMLSGFTDFPDNLPSDIAGINRKNGPKYDRYYFDAFYARLVEFLHSRPADDVNNGTESGSAKLKVETDIPCRIIVDGKERCIAEPGAATCLSMHGGSYRLRFESTENPADFLEDKQFRIDKDTEEWYTVALLPVRLAREAEEVRACQLMQLDDNLFEPYEQNQLWGYRHDKTGETLLPSVYEKVYHFSYGSAWVMRNGKYELINHIGKRMSPDCYDNFSRIVRYQNGRARSTPNENDPVKVSKDGKYGLITNKGEIMTACIYDEIGLCLFTADGLCRVRKDGKWGFIDIMSGKETVACIYDEAGDFFCDIAPVKKNGKWGYISSYNGLEVTPFIYDEAGEFRSTVNLDSKLAESRRFLSQCIRARAKKGGKWGFIDCHGKEVAAFIYEEAYDFAYGRARVRKDGKWGFIDMSGKEIIPCIYCDAEDFVYHFDLYTRVRKTFLGKLGRWITIDQDGQKIKYP